MSSKKKEWLHGAISRWGVCAYCSCPVSYQDYGASFATVDHIIPKSRGGSNGKHNLTLACLDCNRRLANCTNKSPAFSFADL